MTCPACHTTSGSGARFCGGCGAALPLPAGTVLRGYRLLRHLKAGGMGSVYQATTDFGGRFVLKELLDRHGSPAEQRAAVEAFEREARILRALQHAAIPRVVDHFEEGGRWYLVMDQVDGEDLEERLRRLRGRGIPETVVRDWAEQLCRVLEYLHGHQPPIVFRDLKPANIMVTAKNSVMLVDFGIARVISVRRGTQIGTPGYAAPEQYHGMATPRSDVYSLGVTLYHLLTGHSPEMFPPDRMFDSFEWSRVPGPWVPVLRRAVELREQDRWRDVAEFRRALPPPPVSIVAPTSPALPGPPGPVKLMICQAGAMQFLPVPGAGVELASHPVTNEEYAAYVQATGARPPGHWVGGQIPAGLERHPVTWVSLEEARQYAAWVGARLPSEEEWMAAASPDGRPWPWGWNWKPRGNFDSRTTTPVDWYPDGAGPAGHVDLAGNVWEWTTSTGHDGRAVVKGGSCYGPWPVTDRGLYDAQTRNAIIGFRLCR